MLLRCSRLCLLLGALLGRSLADTEPDPTTTTAPCTASSTSGAFYDLRPDIAAVPEEGSKLHRGVRTTDYFAKGYDYNANFTLNICDAVVEPPENVEGLAEYAWKNVSAYYEYKGKVYSIGQQSSALHTRGSQLVLQYTGGSPCGLDKEKRGASSSLHDGARYKGYSEEGQDSDGDTWSGGAKEDDRTEVSKVGNVVSTAKEDSIQRRKSTTFVFICDQDPLNTEAAVSYIATDPDECSYVFKVRSHHACAGAQPHKPGSVGPGSVFAIIFFIAVLVYLVGGVFYQRTVAHARGWRQLPNYSLWLGIWNFLKDMFVILTSSCARCIPAPRGYRALSVSPNGRGRNRDDENRLIDQLDEEWDD